MRTTINISGGILAEVRELARQRDRPFGEVLEEILQLGLSASRQPRRRVRLLTHRVGIKPAYRGKSMNQLYDQLADLPNALTKPALHRRGPAAK